jgi:hypothetical protein
MSSYCLLRREFSYQSPERILLTFGKIVFMIFDAVNTARFRANYKELTRESASGLIYPITVKDTPFQELCAGHVLSKGLQKASRLTVPQRRDVDNFFGATVEADLVKYLNFPILRLLSRLILAPVAPQTAWACW